MNRYKMNFLLKRSLARKTLISAVVALSCAFTQANEYDKQLQCSAYHDESIVEFNKEMTSGSSVLDRQTHLTVASNEVKVEDIEWYEGTPWEGTFKRLRQNTKFAFTPFSLNYKKMHIDIFVSKIFSKEKPQSVIFITLALGNEKFGSVSREQNYNSNGYYDMSFPLDESFRTFKVNPDDLKPSAPGLIRIAANKILIKCQWMIL